MTQPEFDSALARILLTDTADLKDSEIKYALSKRNLLSPDYVQQLREAKAARKMADETETVQS